MKWFRTQIRTGSRLALFALAIQLVLSFGHVHPANARAGTTDSAIESVQLPSPLPAPDQHPADGCDICAVMAMAGTVLLSTPPVLLLPQAVAFLYLATDAEFVHLNSLAGAFQPRGPPLS